MQRFDNGKRIAVAMIALLLSCARVAYSEEMQDMGGMDMQSMMDMAMTQNMPGMYGPYTMTREASGTSWQPDATPLQGMHTMGATWMTMWDGYVDFIDDHQGGPRGATETFTTGMGMFMAQRSLGAGTFGVRTMFSLDPTMGKSGYPLLFQTGETADGVTTLVDRQHPHDAFMELAATYSQNLSTTSSAFIYAGLPGEPALGPTAYMHRASSEGNPETPLAHHWLDSTHVTFGVVTLGAVWRNVKVETSAFNGREPDQYRWNIEVHGLDSYSARLTWNPAPAWSMQISRGRLDSPEQLEPGVAVVRTTASASYDATFGAVHSETTLAWGRNQHAPGYTADAWLLESSAQWGRYTLFARGESVENGELFADSPLPLRDRLFTVRKLTVGGVYDFAKFEHGRFGLGALVSGYDYADVLRASYGDHPLSWMVFLRAKLD